MAAEELLPRPALQLLDGLAQGAAAAAEAEGFFLLRRGGTETQDQAAGGGVQAHALHQAQLLQLPPLAVEAAAAGDPRQEAEKQQEKQNLFHGVFPLRSSFRSPGSRGGLAEGEGER